MTIFEIKGRPFLRRALSWRGGVRAHAAQSPRRRGAGARRKNHRRGLSPTRGRAPRRSPRRGRREKTRASRRRRDPLRHAGTLLDPRPHAALHRLDRARKNRARRFRRDRSQSGPRRRGRAVAAPAGVEVSSGLLAEEAAALNRDFNWWIVRRRPWVVAKIALSLDGRIVTPAGDDRWLTSPAARKSRTNCAGNRTPSWSARKRRGRTIRGSRFGCRGTGAEKSSRGASSSPARENCRAHLHLFSDRHRDRTLVFQNQPLSEVVAASGRKGTFPICSSRAAAKF